MGWFRSTTSNADEAPRPLTLEERLAAIEPGVPGHCPACDGLGYIDDLDLGHRYQIQHCKDCGHRWEYLFDRDGRVVGLTELDEAGQPVAAGQVGELVLRNPNIGFTKSLWRDDERYLDSYWRTIPGLWVHGDFAMRDADGLIYILGRSDDTIKVSGKRTGPSEIETLLTGTGKVSEAAVIGVPDEVKGSAIVCVCVPMPGVAADAALEQELSAAVVKGMGSSYRPRQVVLVSDLPKTRNMKIMRRVVRSVYKGDSPGDMSSLVNPEAVAELQARLSA